MEYLAVGIYIECFALTSLKKSTLPPLNLCWYICLNEETIGLKKTPSHLLISVLYICLNEETISLKKTPSHLLIYVYTYD